MIYVFEDCKIDTRLYTLQRAGQTLRLRPKVFQVLLYLLEHRDTVVSKQELAEQVWPDQFISDATLESTVRSMRQVLGDSGRKQWFIQTLPGHGYRFIARITGQSKEEGGPRELDDPSPDRDSTPAPERRQLTVLACDLVDAISLPERLAADDFRSVLRAYKEQCTEVIRRFEGSLAQALGARLLAYFGYPQAHEDDAQRAVHAGLGILEVIDTWNRSLPREKAVGLAVHLGIHTGLVVVGDLGEGGGHETLTLGETPHISVQIQDIAASDTVVMSNATARLVEGYFVCQELGDHALNGAATPMPLSRVLAVSEARSRLEVLGPKRLIPLVGRDAELTLLLERWAQAKENMGQVVLVRGEAGIGKSRLLQAMKDRLPGGSHTLLECRCSPYHQQSTFYPVIDLLQRALQWQQGDTPDQKLEKLETLLTQYDQSLGENVPLFAALLSLPLSDDSYPPLRLSPQQQRQKTLQALLAYVLALASRQPVLLMVEDLHWLDPSTLEWLTILLDHLPAAPLYALFTCRPNFDVPWSSRSYITQLTLAPLPRHQVEQMVTRVTGGKPLPAEVLQRVVDQTDGVPLFVEECTKTVLESGLLRESADHYELTAALPTLTIPTTLHDSLMARLDRLETAKRVAQLGAALGRQFSHTLLHAVWQEDKALLQRELERLVEAELVYQRGLPPQTTYVFKHALIQETAYQSLLKSTRQQYHARIAHVLTEQFPDTAALQPELLAHHYTEAGLSEQAIPYWQRAGERAVERSANVEAISHFTTGLELLKTLPETPERVQQELALQCAMGSPLMMLKGDTAPEVEYVYTRAYELAQKIGDDSDRFSVLMGLWSLLFSRAHLQRTRELAEQCHTLAQRQQDVHLLQEAYLALGSTLLHLGNHVSARDCLAQGLALYDSHQNANFAFSGFADPRVVCLSRLAWTLWMLGYAEQALAKSREALTLAQEGSHIYSRVFALHFAGLLHQCRREVQIVQEFAEKEMELSSKHGFVQWMEGSLMLYGWALAQQGAMEEGIAKLRQGLDAWLSRGNELGKTQILARLVEAYVKAGHTVKGLHVVAEALEAVHSNGERHYEAELYRLKGELLLQCRDKGLEHEGNQPDLSEVEACFRRITSIIGGG